MLEGIVQVFALGQITAFGKQCKAQRLGRLKGTGEVTNESLSSRRRPAPNAGTRAIVVGTVWNYAVTMVYTWQKPKAHG
jgi:hypothetical protein